MIIIKDNTPMRMDMRMKGQGEKTSANKEQDTNGTWNNGYYKKELENGH